jgi:hypothetical protein
MHAATAFGLIWRSELPLEHFTAAPDLAGEPDVRVHLVRELADRTAGRSINRGQVFADGFRFTWNEIATFDVFDGTRIDILPLSGWTGALPWPFYSTVTALLLAWRGHLPLHACAVEIAGKALLLCGPSGAGKSTLCAALVADGAQLLSDDLTVIRPGTGGQPPCVLHGRQGIRLLPAVAEKLPSATMRPVEHDHRHKVMVMWPDSKTILPTAIAAVILLQDDPAPIQPISRLIALRQQLFRPKWLSVLPNASSRFNTLTAAASTVAVFAFPPLGPFGADSMGARIAELKMAMAGLQGSKHQT